MGEGQRPGPDKRLFTPGPLTTSAGVKQAMLRDLGSRDEEFVALVRHVRAALCRVAGLEEAAGYQAVPVQGSGTHTLEAVIGSALPRDGRLLVLANGAYGARLAEISRRLGIQTHLLSCPEQTPHDPAELERALAREAVDAVAMVHCETSTGLLNPVDALARIASQRGRSVIVDAMSAFGAVPLDLPGCGVDFLVASANKCLEGVPGFGFAICRREALAACEGRARSLALDLFAQWRGLEETGQFRFTPPTHVFLALAQALAELNAEGGVAGRAARYTESQRVLVEGMQALGFEPFLPAAQQSCVITAFRTPSHPRFAFADFYRRLSERGFLIYPGSLSSAATFRIGTIGRIFPDDLRALLGAIGEVLRETGVELQAAQPAASRRSTSG